MLEIDIFFIISLLLFFTGFISGILAGFFGIGGGIIVVPVIYHLFNSLDFSQNISNVFDIYDPPTKSYNERLATIQKAKQAQAKAQEQI